MTRISFVMSRQKHPSIVFGVSSNHIENKDWTSEQLKMVYACKKRDLSCDCSLPRCLGGLGDRDKMGRRSEVRTHTTMANCVACVRGQKSDPGP